MFGPRRTLIRIVLWWSFFTALTAIVGLPVGEEWIIGIWALVVIRFLFGIGEAGAFPNITRALHNWFPLTERALTQGAVWMSGRLMGGLTPLVWFLLVEQYQLVSWRGAFLVFGVLGILWCVAFASWFRNRPEEKPEVNAAERALIHGQRQDDAPGHAGVPWLQLFTNGNLWALCLMYFCASYGWYFNITYLHNFLEKQYGVDPRSMLGAIYKGGPAYGWKNARGLPGWRLATTDALIREVHRQSQMGQAASGARGSHSLAAVCWLASCSRRTHSRSSWRFPWPPLLQRPDDGPRLGYLPGHRPTLRGHRGGVHEYSGQPRRRGGRLGNGYDP